MLELGGGNGKPLCFYSLANSFLIGTAVINTHPVLFPPRPGWAPDPLMVGIRSPDGLVVGSCTSHPGVQSLGSSTKAISGAKTGKERREGKKSGVLVHASVCCLLVLDSVTSMRKVADF